MGKLSGAALSDSSGCTGDVLIFLHILEKLFFDRRRATSLNVISQKETPYGTDSVVPDERKDTATKII